MILQKHETIILLFAFMMGYSNGVKINCKDCGLCKNVRLLILLLT